jgi:Ni,Fe-hydrogenase III large subunit
MRRPVPVAASSLAASRAAGADGFVRLDVDERDWICLALGCAAGLQDLLGLWPDAGAIHMALGVPAQGMRCIVSLQLKRTGYPSVALNHVPAMRLERAIRDLHGIEAKRLPDQRGWLDHGRWPSPPPALKAGTNPAASGYAFLPVEGEGLHQIPVGPVHAGIIEPGHFRFTANGEAVVRLEERLGYVHKGVEALCAGAGLEQAARIAGRISGDSTVAYSFAFARAAESILGWQVPPRATLLRGVMAELERLAHHVNDIGAICNDASVVALHARCTLLRERLLQTAAACFGHRLMMDRIVPGGVAADLGPEGPSVIDAVLTPLSIEFERIMHVYDESPSLQDRTVSTGRVRPELAAQFAAGGFVGRASGRAFDTRLAYPYAPYDQLPPVPALRSEGDVDARLGVRAEEIRASIGLIRQLLARLEPGPIASPAPAAKAGAAAAMVEAFRGDVLIHVRLDDAGRVAHFHARDASWFQWPLLEAAIEGNIVADFPLCNKSFNCSYAGHDL